MSADQLDMARLQLRELELTIGNIVHDHDVAHRAPLHR